jgi:enoyl-CoA hydratase
VNDYSEIAIDRVGTDGRVARIALNRPERLNTLTPTTIGELNDALHAMEPDRTIRVIILRGAGTSFSAGYDLGGVDLMASTGYSGETYVTHDDQGRALAMNFANGLKRGAEVQQYLWGMAKITIAEVHGYCIAGGMEWAMMADLVTVANDAIIGHPGSRGLGVARNAAILPLLTSLRKAKELLITGDSVSGEQAERLGLANYAWPPAELEQNTIALADRVANMSADHLAMTKAAANRFVDNMGIHASIASATYLDALGQHTESHYEWQDKLEKEGLKAALEWRDKPYGDYSFRPR